jgi:hypothetical protein
VHHLLFTFIVPKFFNFYNHLIINSKKNTMLLLCYCKIFSIYFLLLALKIGPFFDYLGDNYFFYILYHAFTLAYFLVIQLNYMHKISHFLIKPCNKTTYRVASLFMRPFESSMGGVFNILHLTFINLFIARIKEEEEMY